MRSVDTCNPLSPIFLDSYLLSLLASLYNICTEQLPTECLLAKTVLKDKDTETLFDAYTHFLPLQAPFPTINKLMHVALTLLVSMTQCERSFSTLGRIKTHLRSTMSNNRLADISLLSLERDLCSVPTFIEETIQEFEGIDKNRTISLF